MCAFSRLKTFSLAVAASVFFSANCKADGPVIATTVTTSVAEIASAPDDISPEMQQLRFIATNHDLLSRDIANGEGEYLDTLAYLMGCSVEANDRFTKLAQKNFNQIYSQPETNAREVLENLTIQVSNDPILPEQCNLGS